MILDLPIQSSAGRTLRKSTKDGPHTLVVAPCHHIETNTNYVQGGEGTAMVAIWHELNLYLYHELQLSYLCNYYQATV